MKTRIRTILLIFSATLLLSLILFTEIVTTANAVNEHSQTTTDIEAGSNGAPERIVAAVNFDITVNIDGGSGVNSVSRSANPPYVLSQTVTLSAVPDAAWYFDHWEGDLSGTDSPQSLEVTPATVVTAFFKQRCFNLTRSHTGLGGDPVPNKANSAICPAGQYVAGELINFSATADPHWVIAGWTGTDGGSSSTLTMPAADRQVIVNYSPICYTLTTSVIPTVAGTINRSLGPNCPPPGPATSYLEGTIETLTATALDGYRFTNWSGNASGTVPETTVTMDNNYSVTANFAKGCHPLLLTHAPPGTGSNPQASPSSSAGCNPGEYVFDENISLKNAIPNPGWRVERWEGTNNDNSTSSSNSLTFPRLPSGSSGSDHTVTVYYIQKPTLQFSAGSYNVNENAGSANITVKRTGSLQEKVTVFVKSSDDPGDSATVGVDYEAISQTLTFPKDNAEQTFAVQILDDGTSEGTESFKLALSNQSSTAELGPQFEAELIILDDEGEPAVQFSTTTYEAVESSSSVPVTITLFPPSASSVFVEFNTLAGTATNGEDYFDKTQTIRFWPGDENKQVTVALVDDTLDEIDETIHLQLSGVEGASPGVSDAVLTLLDDDDPPSVQFSTGAYFAKEGQPAAPLTVTLSAATSLPVAVDYTVVELSNGRQIVGNIIFNPGEVVKTIDVSIAGNQANDILNALLSGAINASLGSPSSANLTILDKDRSDCYALTLNYTGYGSSPTPTNMPQSVGCPAGKYVANELISLLAQPDPGWRVDGWQGTLNDNDAVSETVVRMPDSDHAVTANYVIPTFLTSLSNIFINYFEGPMEAEPNGAIDTNKANGPIRSGQRYFGNFSTASDAFDVFYFNLPAKGNVQIDLTSIPTGRDYNLYLWTINKDLVGYSGALDDQNEHISNSDLNPGFYFVGIHNATGTPSTSQYSVNVTYE